MSNLDERLHGIDRLSPPDLWERAQSRASIGSTRGTSLSPRRRIAIVAFGLVFGLAAVAWLVVELKFDGSTTASTSTTVAIPNVAQKNAESAKSTLTGLGLVPEVTKRASDDVAAGRVIE